MAANFWNSSHCKQLLDQEEVDVVHDLDKERGISINDFKLIKFHMSNHIMKLAQHIKVRQRVVATAITYIRRVYTRYYMVALREDRKFSTLAPFGGFAFIAAWATLLF